METARSLGTGKSDGFVVRTPRETDAIGGALCGAFSSRIDLPADMHSALERLDKLQSF